MKNYSSGASRYYQTQITTADKREIILYLYDGAIRFMNRGIEAMENGQIPERCINLGRAMDIVMELSCMLDFERGGELAERLNALYNFTLQQMLFANSGNPEGTKQVRHAVTIISMIREAWNEIIKGNLDNSEPLPAGGPHDIVG